MSISIGAALDQAVARLTPAVDLPHLEAELLLCHIVGKPRTWLVAWPEKRLTDRELARFMELVEQREQGAPVAYLTGEREFWSLALKVTEDTLIPRPETELLVETVLERFGDNRELTLVDMGTGSGAIALAIAKEKPGWRVIATDISAAALAIARTNAEEHGITNVSFAQGDWYDALPTETHVDVIVSNPPYVAEADPHLEQGDVRFEPRHALASGSDGLDDIRKLLPGAIVHLKEGGFILVEHGNTQGTAVRDLMRHYGYRDIRTLRDLEGHERVTLGIYRAMPI
jgi:release factor glutamine methyltransferase